VRGPVTALLAAAAVLVGGAGAAPPPDRVLAVEWRGGGGQLRWVHARTLAPAGGAVANLAGAPANLVATSPDGRTAALGGGEGGRLRLLDLGRPRSLAVLRLGEGHVQAATWPTPQRLVALVAAAAAATFAVVDPVAGDVVRRATVAGTPLASAAAAGRLVALLAPGRTIGAARLAIADGSGAVRVARLPGTAAGIESPRRPGLPVRQAVPALALSPDGRRAAVVSPTHVTVVDLRTLRATTRPLSARAPARAAKLLEGWTRTAVWAGTDTVAVSGAADSLAEGTYSHLAHGLELVDVRTGSRTRLDDTASRVSRAGRTLVGHGGTAIRGFGLDGAVRFAVVDPDGDSGWLGRSGRYLYVASANATRYVVVDAVTGRVVGRARTARPTAVIGP
jgi:hypothetical protein